MKILRLIFLVGLVVVVARGLGLVWGEGADWRVYQGAVGQFLAGRDPYEAVTGIPFNYPPSSLLWFSIWRGLGWQVWWLAGLGSLVVSLYWLVGRNWWWWFLVCCLLFPVKFTLGMGQVNLMILLGYVAIWRLYKADKWLGVGLVLGVMISIKVLPVLLVPWLVLRREYRAVGMAVMVVVAMNLVADGVSNYGLVSHYVGMVRELVGLRVTSYYNQSLPALAYRWLPESLSGIVGLGLSGVMLGVSYVVDYRERLGVLGYVLSLTAITLAPGIVWQHQLVWLIPAVVMSFELVVSSKLLSVWWLVAVLSIGANLPGLGGVMNSHGVLGGAMLWLLVLKMGRSVFVY